MKIDRLIGILSILLQEEKTTAPELAERFEVSRRTINRDIEDLCKAGIPIKTAQGTGGGISIMDGYRMDRTILSSKDMQMILAGLRSLDSVSGSRYYSQLMEKIQTGSSEFISGRDSMLIDLSSWYKGSLAPKIEVIQSAIENRRIIRFKYYAPSGESNRRVEPYYLVFRWSSWYVWGWCLERKDYRLFKLNRMDCVVETDRGFLRRDVPMPDLSNEKIFPGGIKVKALFTPNMKWRLVEEFGPNCFTETDDGSLLFSADYTDMENLVTWLMTFGAKVEVLEPEEVRDIIRRNAEEILNLWRIRKMRLDGFGLFVDDMAKMVCFYKDVLGFEIKEEENTSNVYLVKDGTLFLLYGRNDFEKMTNRRYEYIKGLNGHSEIALYVDTFEEVDEVYKKAVENGATSVLEPELEPWGQRTCYIADPEGNLIEIGSWNKPYEEKDLEGV